MLRITPRRWTSQPQTPVGIDWSNPITQGINPLPFNGANPFSNGWTLTDGTFGSAVSPLGVGTKGTMRFSGPTVSTNTPYTVLVVATQPASTTSYSVSAGVNSRVWLGSATGYMRVSDLTNDLIAGACTLNKPSVLIGTWDGTRLSSMLDGVSGQSITSSMGAGGPLLVMNFGTGYPYAGNVALVLWWTRVLSPAELASLSANPWQIFSPALC